jgi:hypothetical protein
MAYHARIQRSESQSIALPAMRAESVAKPEFSALEWSIIRLARIDGLSTIRAPNLLCRFYNWVIGRTGSPQLANPRLEGLRRIAVLSWQFGFTVPGQDVGDFLSAGFTPDQYELLVTSVRAAAGTNVRSISPEALA